MSYKSDEGVRTRALYGCVCIRTPHSTNSIDGATSSGIHIAHLIERYGKRENGPEQRSPHGFFFRNIVARCLCSPRSHTSPTLASICFGHFQYQFSPQDINRSKRYQIVLSH